ncbi:MAG TPA: glycerol-3-phosphate 1-O-acyltransferase PlsY [Stellaceae bacterium]|nr:glycerol-3-phosphate 1-O-acyltransferase PlsY [Stellaceae bacterium]
MPLLFATALFAYLLGSIPFGLVLTRLAGLGDIRRIGSGNIGATNVLRTGNRWLAAGTLLLDGGKGAVAVLIAGHFDGNAALVAAAASVLGHLFPVWLGFKGGKGVATTLGVLLALAPPVGVIACLTWLLVATVFRYSSLAALTALALSPLFAWAIEGWQVAAVAAFLAALVIVRHHENIRRLIDGSESRINLGGKRPAAQ